MDRDLVTVEEAARISGSSPAAIRRRISAGELEARSVEVRGRLEVRLPLDQVRRLKAGPAGVARPPAPAPQAPAAAPPAEPEPAPQPAPEAQAPGPGAGASTSLAQVAPTEIRQLATELAEELFQRWELAMDQRFQQELKIRLEAELAHREHQVQDLSEEVEQRVELWKNPWPRNKGYNQDTWERERTIIRQSREVREMERQIEEMRQRLRELGHTPSHQIDASGGPSAGPARDLGEGAPGTGQEGGAD